MSLNINLKAIALLVATGMASHSTQAVSAESDVITLDLSKATTPLTFNPQNGSWTGTYDDDAETIDSQVFSFVHGSISDWNVWWGFTASNHADNTRPANTLVQQWSNMACGGIVLNADGSVKTDSFGAPVVSADVPYLVGFYAPFMSARPVDMCFTVGKSYKPVGIYVNLNSYAYYSMEYGDSFARAFTNGDKFTLTIHGVATDETEKEVNVSLCEYSNGNLTINRGWRYVDLSDLGEVNELYFTMETTDSGAYGANTPLYFCIDKLTVAPGDNSAASGIKAENGVTIAYDKASHTVTLTNADFAVVYDMAGNKVMMADSSEFSIDNLSAGVYVVRAGDKSLKIAK